jgi:hypothetical protein
MDEVDSGFFEDMKKEKEEVVRLELQENRSF